jgi:hypothetical protein
MNDFSGSVILYRIFDIGHEIDLKNAQGILSKLGHSEEFRLRRGVKSVVIEEVPLILYLNNIVIHLDNRDVNTTVVAKIWNFGALSISFKIDFPQKIAKNEMVHLSSKIYENEGINEISKEKAFHIIENLTTSIKGPKLWDQFEEYVIYIDNEAPASEEKINNLINDPFLYQLLLAEPKAQLSRYVKESIKANQLQYSQNDLVVLDWDSAYVISEGDSQDICDVIEFANVQLLELRYYDELLDKKLSALYKEVMLANQSIFNKKYKKLNQEAIQIYLEISEVVERIENSLKVVGDVFYGRVFRSALERFKIKEWKSNVDNKLKNLLDVSHLNNQEIQNKRSQFMEFVIVILIAVEVFPFLYSLIFR